MAMDDRKVIARGTLQHMLEQAGETNLEEAFICSRAINCKTRRPTNGRGFPTG